MKPLGHLSISYVAAKAFPGLSELAVLAGGLAPDIDFALVYFPWFGKIHRVVTHNLFFGIGAGLLAGSLAPKGRKTAVGLGFGLGALLHLLADGDMLINSEPGHGVALFYPLDKRMVSRFRFGEPRVDSGKWRQPSKRLRESLIEMETELPFALAAGAVGFITWWWRKRK
jgi:membrane-bound metal-dependent hydrolase YbcI (DUF457 family)